MAITCAANSFIQHERDVTPMSDVTLKILTPDDAPDLWRINEEGLPGVGKVTPEAMGDLLEFAEFALGAVIDEELVAFVIVPLPGTSYGSPN